MGTAKIAAIVPCFNRKDKTIRFLHRIQRQTYGNLDVIVVDASSTDGTHESVKLLFPQTIILQVSSDAYWTASTNTGVRFALDAGYDYVLTINDDCLVDENYVEKLLDIAQRYEVPILGSRIDYLPQPGLIWSLGTGVIWGTRLLKLNTHDVLETQLGEEFRSRDVIYVKAMPGNGVLIHRSVFEKIGLYNEKMLPHYHGDSEFVMRAVRHGIESAVTQRAIVYDDSPLPQQQKQGKLERPAKFWIEDFFHTFFHQRSGWYLLPRTYIILKYCPWHQKVQTLVQGTFGVMVGWLGLRVIAAVKRSRNPHSNPQPLPEPRLTKQSSQR
jgi:GT2 family glycosyltransferase